MYLCSQEMCQIIYLKIIFILNFSFEGNNEVASLLISISTRHEYYITEWMITLIANHERAVVRWPQCVRTMVQHSTALQCYKLQQVIHTSSSHRGQHSQWRHLWHLILTVNKKTVIVDWIDMHVHYVYIYCYCLLWKISMWNENSLPPCQP